MDFLIFTGLAWLFIIAIANANNNSHQSSSPIRKDRTAIKAERSRKLKSLGLKREHYWFESINDDYEYKPWHLEFLVDLDKNKGNLQKQCDEGGESLEAVLEFVKSDPILFKSVKVIVMKYSQRRYERYFGRIKSTQQKILEPRVRAQDGTTYKRVGASAKPRKLFQPEIHYKCYRRQLLDWRKDFIPAEYANRISSDLVRIQYSLSRLWPKLESTNFMSPSMEKSGNAEIVIQNNIARIVQPWSDMPDNEIWSAFKKDGKLGVLDYLTFMKTYSTACRGNSTAIESLEYDSGYLYLTITATIAFIGYIQQGESKLSALSKIGPIPSNIATGQSAIYGFLNTQYLVSGGVTMWYNSIYRPM